MSFINESAERLNAIKALAEQELAEIEQALELLKQEMELSRIGLENSEKAIEEAKRLIAQATKDMEASQATGDKLRSQMKRGQEILDFSAQKRESGKQFLAEIERSLELRKIIDKSNADNNKCRADILPYLKENPINGVEAVIVDRMLKIRFPEGHRIKGLSIIRCMDHYEIALFSLSDKKGIYYDDDAGYDDVCGFSTVNEVHDEIKRLLALKPLNTSVEEKMSDLEVETKCPVLAKTNLYTKGGRPSRSQRRKAKAAKS